MAADAWNPKQYDKYKAERSQPFFDLMSLLQTHEGAQVIDVGCGTGELTAELHRSLKAASTVGFDSSAEMLKKADAFATSGLSFSKGEIESWKPQTQFDIIFSNAALQWCAEQVQIFQKLKSALRPNGQLAVQMPMNFDYPTHTLASQMSSEEPWFSLLRGQRYAKQASMLTPEEYAKLMFRLGFKEQKVFLRVYGHVLESREDVVEWVKGTLLTHFESRLNETDYKKFMDEFRARLFKKIPDDKPFFYPFKRILIWGRL